MYARIIDGQVVETGAPPRLLSQDGPKAAPCLYHMITWSWEVA